MKRSIVWLLTLVGLCSACVREESAAPQPVRNDTGVYGGEIVPGWVRLRLCDDAQPLRVGVFTRGAVATGNERIDRLAAELGATEVRCVFPTDPRFEKRHRRYGLHLWYDVKIDETVAVTRAAERFAGLEGVDYVGPIYRMGPADRVEYGSTIRSGASPAADGEWQGSLGEGEHAAPFDDPMLKWQWHYDNDGSMPASVEGADIGIYEVWKDASRKAGDPTVIVAVMDGGSIDYAHEDLAANIWVNAGEIPGNGVDDDGNGYVDDVYGYDFCNNTGDLTPVAHATHVGGTVAAVNNNGIGVCGVAGGSGNGDGVRLMSCPLYSAEDDETTGVAAYVYAADNGAVISQNSWNFPKMDQTPFDVKVALDYFVNEAGKDDDGNQTGPMAGGVVFFSAGNTYSTTTVNPPAQEANVVCVASMRPDYMRATYSNMGADVDIFAPGGAGTEDPPFGAEGKVLSTGWNQEEGYTPNGYVYMSGTSMACPHVSGVAALIVANYGGAGFTADKLKEMLLRSYRPVDAYLPDPSIAERLGVGLLDAGLMGLEKTAADPAAPTRVAAEAREGEEQTLYLTIEGVPADANGMPVASFRVTCQATSGEEETTLSVPNRYSVGETLTTAVTGLADATTYAFSVWAVDRFGRQSADAVACEGTTLAHANREPEMVESLQPVTLPQGNGEFSMTIDLTKYFTDPDLPNDELTYTAESRDEQVVTVDVQEGSKLVIEAHKKGSTIVGVTVTDRAGASITRNMSVTVSQDNPDDGGEEPTDPELPALREGLNLYPNPVRTTATIGLTGAADAAAEVRIYDGAARLVMTVGEVVFGAEESTTPDRVTCDLSALSAGHYVMAVRLEDGTEYHAPFMKQ